VSRINSAEELEVFKRSHKLTLDVYKVTEGFPQAEKFGLVTQMRRAAVSIGSNLLEGSHRLSRKEFRQFVGISKGSAGELKYHLLVAKDLGYLPESIYCSLKAEVEQVSMMLSGLVKSLTDSKHWH
jgi:four helix bundle protein